MDTKFVFRKNHLSVFGSTKANLTFSYNAVLTNHSKIGNAEHY
jgi:hypothetical protein